MKKYILPIVAGLALSFGSCESNPSMDLGQVPFIPVPNVAQATGTSFKLQDGMPLVTDKPMNNLQMQLEEVLGFELSAMSSEPLTSAFIMFKLDDQLSENAYELMIGEDVLEIKGGSEAAIFYGIQTLRQMLPAESEAVKSKSYYVASGHIKDEPRYSYRGTMLDVSRHFFGVEDVKSYIDYLAMYKMNVFHMHLADDQGWRIEIKSWPDLAIKGGAYEVGGGKGGYYTQEQFKEIVDYAASKYIEVIPEIDMPGHINAALHAYPELNPKDEAPEYYTGTEVGFSTLTLDDPDTWRFVDDVIRELSEISPSEFIHIGGDETHATSEEDYEKFIPRITAVVEKYGKRAMGWADIAKAELEPNTVAQFWKPDPVNVKMALDQGVQIVMSPATNAYLDMKYDSETALGLTWAGTIEIDKGYNWDPSTYLGEINTDQILGMEAALWTETVEDMDDLQYLVFPRLTGYGEVAWSKQDQRNWDEYRARLKKHLKRLDAMEINYYHSPILNQMELKD